MGRSVAQIGRIGGVALAASLLASCAALAPGRAVRSTVVLAPGQAVRGRITLPDGGSALVQFFREPPRRGMDPQPESWTWTAGDGHVTIAFPHDPRLPDAHPLAYAQTNARHDRPVAVIVRNSGAGPATFCWSVTSANPVDVAWEVATAE